MYFSWLVTQWCVKLHLNDRSGRTLCIIIQLVVALCGLLQLCHMTGVSCRLSIHYRWSWGRIYSKRIIRLLFTMVTRQVRTICLFYFTLELWISKISRSCKVELYPNQWSPGLEWANIVIIFQWILIIEWQTAELYSSSLTLDIETEIMNLTTSQPKTIISLFK